MNVYILLSNFGGAGLGAPCFPLGVSKLSLFPYRLKSGVGGVSALGLVYVHTLARASSIERVSNESKESY